MKELLTEARNENLDLVQKFVNRELENTGCQAGICTRISVAVEEIFVNIANYAYTTAKGDVKIRVSVGDEIVIEFEDSGTPFNPLTRQDPDIEAALDDREIGGLGILMVKNIMDKVEYRNENNKNILVITKTNQDNI